MAAVGDVYECKIICRAAPSVLNVQNSVNVRHYRVTQVAGIAKPDFDIAQALEQNFGPPYKAAQSPDVSFRGVIIRKIFPLPAGGPTISQILLGDGTRATTGDLLPMQVSGMITLRTLFAGRAKRGRVYFPFPGEDDAIDSIPLAAYVGVLNTVAVSFLNNIAVGALPDVTTLEPVLFHRATPGMSDALSNALGRTYFVTQRRRGQAGGSDTAVI